MTDSPNCSNCGGWHKRDVDCPEYPGTTREQMWNQLARHIRFCLPCHDHESLTYDANPICPTMRRLWGALIGDPDADYEKYTDPPHPEAQGDDMEVTEVKGVTQVKLTRARRQ